MKKKKTNTRKRVGAWKMVEKNDNSATPARLIRVKRTPKGEFKQFKQVNKSALNGLPKKEKKEGFFTKLLVASGGVLAGSMLVKKIPMNKNLVGLGTAGVGIALSFISKNKNAKAFGIAVAASAMVETLKNNIPAIGSVNLNYTATDTISNINGVDPLSVTN